MAARSISFETLLHEPSLMSDVPAVPAKRVDMSPLRASRHICAARAVKARGGNPSIRWFARTKRMKMRCTDSDACGCNQHLHFCKRHLSINVGESELPAVVENLKLIPVVLGDNHKRPF
jgi:hypothetical protein